MLLKITSRQEAGLQAVLHAARRTAFYKDRLQTIEMPLMKYLDWLPQVDFNHFDGNRAAFRNPQSGRRKAEFRYPLQPSPKVSLLLDGCKRRSSVKAETLAAPVHILREMASVAGPQRYPVVAFTGVRHGTLTQADRDVFWEAYQVPVFEQWLGLEDEPVAEECEAHDGLHVREDDAIFELRSGELVVTSLHSLEYPVLRMATGHTATLDRSLCACGTPGLRLMDVAQLIMEKSFRASAG